MRKPNSNEIICVNCGSIGVQAAERHTGSSRFQGNGVDLHTPSEDPEELRDVEVAPLPLRERLSQAPEPTEPDLDDSSQALADKLLAGWTLLAEHCPRSVRKYTSLHN